MALETPDLIARLLDYKFPELMLMVSFTNFSLVEKQQTPYDNSNYNDSLGNFNLATYGESFPLSSI